jgi:error-prone DNA polymerase
MGFYQPFTLIKDAQRHGLQVRPVDVMCSDWLCTIEQGDQAEKVLRLGLKYVKGMREEVGLTIMRERTRKPFASIDDLSQRVPELRKEELRKLAAVGALNFIQSDRSTTPAPKYPSTDITSGLKQTNRRDALWQVERVSRPAGPLYCLLQEEDANSPLLPMTVAERMDADFRGTGMTIGKHPVAFHRDELQKLGAFRAVDTYQMRNGSRVVVGGWVIVRQRPGTAKGFVFLTLEDETGVSNIIITPQLFDKNRLNLVNHPFLLIEGTLQHQDNVVSVKAKRIRPLSFKMGGPPSHDFR